MSLDFLGIQAYLPGRGRIARGGLGIFVGAAVCAILSLSKGPARHSVINDFLSGVFGVEEPCLHRQHRAIRIDHPPPARSPGERETTPPIWRGRFINFANRLYLFGWGVIRR